jgi:predicted TIM-barrel fold metal-dependent hydrolase
MLIDVHVSLGHWPFQPLRPRTPAQLARHLAVEGIDHAYVAPVDAILYPDPHLGNEELLPRLRGYPTLRPVGVVNPALANWRETLDASVEWGARMVKLLPNYHAYPLDAPFVDDLRQYARERGVRVAVQVRVEDERNQYPRMQIPNVDLASLIAFAQRLPEEPLLALGAYFHEAVELVRGTPNVLVDLAAIERLDTLRSFLREVPSDRVLFGSHTPFFYTRAAVMKLRDAELDGETEQAIAADNARRFLGCDE